MAKLTSEMQALFREQLAVVATASRDGTPNAGPKGSLHVVDDETIAWSEGTGEKTLRNLKENPKVSIVIIDRAKGDGYQVRGKAELLTQGDLFEQVARKQEERKRPRPKQVVKVAVQEVYSLKPGMTATKIA